MASSNSGNPDLSRYLSSSSASKAQPLSDHGMNENQNLSSVTIDGIFSNVYNSDPASEFTLLDPQRTMIDFPNSTSTSPAPMPSPATDIVSFDNNTSIYPSAPKSLDDFVRETVLGQTIELKEESPEDFMSLGDFLVESGAVDGEDMKLSGGVFAFDQIPMTPFQALDQVEGAIVGFGSGTAVGDGGSGEGGSRGRMIRQKRALALLDLEPQDKAAQQRQRRMIKNRESAARSRERKKAYQVELESLAVKLEEENEQLLKEQAEITKERRKQLMETVIPVVEKRKPSRVLRRVNSF